MVGDAARAGRLLGGALLLRAPHTARCAHRAAVRAAVAAIELAPRGGGARREPGRGRSAGRRADPPAGAARRADAGIRAPGSDRDARSLGVDARARHPAVALLARDARDPEFPAAQARGDRPRRAGGLRRRVADPVLPDQRRRHGVVLSRLDRPRSADAARHRHRRGAEERARGRAEGQSARAARSSCSSPTARTTANELAKQLAVFRAEGYRVHCIGIGSDRDVPVPVLDAEGRETFLRDTDGKVVRTKFEEATLRQIAAARAAATSARRPAASSRRASRTS